MNEKSSTLKATFNQAVENYNKKNFKIAEQLYGQILKTEPNHFASILHLGLIFLNTRNLVEAKKLCEKAIKIQPSHCPVIVLFDHIKSYKFTRLT